MDKEAVNVYKNLLESDEIGIKPAYEWVEQHLDELKQKYGLFRFKVEPRDYELIGYEEGETILGQEELEDEAIGFVAVFIDGNLRMLSVFADLKERIVRVQKIDHKKETFLEIRK